MRTVGASTHTHTPCLSLVVRLSTLQAYILRLTAHLSYVLVEGDRRGRVLQEHVGHADLERCQLGPEPGTRDKTRGGGGGCGGLNNTRCGGGRELGRVEQRGGDLRRQSKKKKRTYNLDNHGRRVIPFVPVTEDRLSHLSDDLIGDEVASS